MKHSCGYAFPKPPPYQQEQLCLKCNVWVKTQTVKNPRKVAAKYFGWNSRARGRDDQK